MEQKTTEKRAVVLFGPTAVGKTALTKALFSQFYEVVNADSVQVYRYLDIASAKPDSALMSMIPHHLVDIRNPWEQYTSGDFCLDTERLVDEIGKRGNIPLITGGTAYYFKQLLYGPSQTPPSDPGIREEVRSEIERDGLEKAYSYLMENDPAAAIRIDRNDRYRISRAIEVLRQTGRPLSSFPISDTLRSDISFTLIGLRRDRDELGKRIRERVEIMFREGAVEEMGKLLEMGASLSWPGMQGIGYREWLSALESGETSLSLIKEDIIRSSRKYAKRQMTFFSSIENTRWFHPDDIEGIRKYLEEEGLPVPSL